MASDSATDAWSQLVQSIISGSPPSDMLPEFYHTCRGTSVKYLREQSQRLEMCKYEQDGIKSSKLYEVVEASLQGMELSQDSMRSDICDEVVQANEHENQQGIEYIQDCMRSETSCVVQADECENQQGIDHIRDCMRSDMSYEMQENECENQNGIEHIQDCMRSEIGCDVLAGESESQQKIEHIRDCMRSEMSCEVVQTNENEIRQGIEYNQDRMRSDMRGKVMQANDPYNQYGIEHILTRKRSRVLFEQTKYEDHQPIRRIRHTTRTTRSPKALQEAVYGNQQNITYMQAVRMSTWFEELLELVENGGSDRRGKLTLQFKVLQVIKLLHHYGVDTIWSGVAEELEYVNQNFCEIEKDSKIYHKKKYLELMLRICENETCQNTIYEIIGKAQRDEILYC